MPPPDQWFQPWLQEWLTAPTPRWAAILLFVIAMAAAAPSRR